MQDLYQWAAAYCAKRECCRSDVLSKLLAKGTTRTEAEAILEKLKAERFIDESRYARAYVNDKFRFDHWGRTKIRYQLLLKKIPESSIDEALSQISEEAYLQAVKAFILSRTKTLSEPDPFKAGQKIARAAISRGFEPYLVFQVLNLE